MRVLLVSLIAAFSLFLSTSAVYAGGGLIGFTVSSPHDGAYFASPGEAFTVHFQVDQNLTEPCKQCPVTVVFENPQSGDIVNPLSDKTDDKGEISVKVSSGVAYIRYIHAVATLPNGTIYT
jgi:hypothetical protein